MRRGVVLVVALAAAAACSAFATAQTPPTIAPVPKTCETPATTVFADSPLANTAKALRDRKKINILAIGSTSASSRGPVSGGYFFVLEKFLEATFKGLDVIVVHRGVSGELAADAAVRIKNEVALTQADIVLWQLGTADALARVPVEDFQNSVSDVVAWLKQNHVDVILVGLRYTRTMVTDLHYQAIRKVISAIAKDQNVMRFGRYDAEETLEKIRAGQGLPMTEAEVTESGYVCMAEYLARAIAMGLFLKAPKAAPSPPPPAPRPTP